MFYITMPYLLRYGKNRPRDQVWKLDGIQDLHPSHGKKDVRRFAAKNKAPPKRPTAAACAGGIWNVDYMADDKKEVSK